jgi:magnesium chelatase family protein
MLAMVYSCAVVGLDGALVEVEVDLANGLPYIDFYPASVSG